MSKGVCNGGEGKRLAIKEKVFEASPNLAKSESGKVRKVLLSQIPELLWPPSNCSARVLSPTTGFCG